MTSIVTTNMTEMNDKANYRKTTINGGILKQDESEPMDIDESPFAEEGKTIDDIWSWEYMEAINRVNDEPDSPNTIYKYMTEKQWDNAHWNQGEGQNLPYDCKNKYLRINAGGKKKWQEDELEKTYKYDLKFYKISSRDALPGENKTIGGDWIMKLLDDSLDAEDVWIPHRVCGEVIIGVLAPENYEFSINKLGDRIPHFETPNLSFEYRGIYGVQSQM
jgi:hypothetical protein